MREYLKQFLFDFDYQKNDAEYLLSVYDNLCENTLASDLLNKAIDTYSADINCDFSKLLSIADEIGETIAAHKYTTELLLCICLTKRLKIEYVSRNIDLEIYKNSVLDLRYKLEECKLVKGVVGSFVAYWFDGWFKLKRFALGRLQYELSTLGIERDGLSADSFALAVHIPRSGLPLTPKECDLSFKMAKSFFYNRFSSKCVFTCHSWLLYPENVALLSKESNIYKFAKRFDIVDFGVNEKMPDLWRIFDTAETDLSRLPQNTSLQRAYVEHLKNGGKMGWGFGVIIL